MYLHGKSEVRLNRNITPLLGSTSTATCFVLIHENAQPGSVNYLDALVDLGPHHLLHTASECQLPLPDVMLYLP